MNKYCFALEVGLGLSWSSFSITTAVYLMPYMNMPLAV